MFRLSSKILFLSFIFITFIQAKEFANDRIIIKVKNPLSITAAITGTIPLSVREHTNKIQGKIRGLQNTTKLKIASMGSAGGLTNVYVVTIPPTENISAIIKSYAELSDVAYAEPDYIATTFIIPSENPTYYAIQQIDSYNNMKTEPAWDVCTGSVSVIVALLDTGISLNHEDLRDNISPAGGYDYYNGDSDPSDDNNYSYIPYTTTTVNAFGHGTQVAGAIGAVGNNNIGISGICWRTTLLTGKVFNASGTEARYSDIAQAIIDAANVGAKVINMSFGGTPYSQTLKDACDYAYYQKDVVLVAAMGNSGDGTIMYPAGFDTVIGVGAVNKNNKLSSFSTYGSGSQTTELVAPGEDVLSTCAFTQGLLGGSSTYGKYNVNSGTSFSSPKVAGVCALVRAYYPDLTNIQVRNILRYSSIDLGDSGYDKYYGYGLVNAENAINRASGYTTTKAITKIMNYPNPVTNGETKFSFETKKSIQSAEIIIYDLRGREVSRLTSGSSIMTDGGIYKTGPWDCTDSHGNRLPNGTYIYTVKATDVNGGVQTARGKLAIVR